MADEIPRIAFETFDPAISGGNAPTPVKPERTWGEAFADTGKDLAAGFVDMGRGVVGATEAAQTAFSAKPPMDTRRTMDTLADISGSIRGSRSDSARYLDKEGGPSVWQEPGTYAAHVATGIIPWLPLVPLGAWGAPVAAAIAGGTENSEERERIRSASPEEMANNSQYLSLIQSGLSDEQAREKLWEINSDPTKAETWKRRGWAMAGNALGFGAGAAAGKAALRGGASEMTTRIMNSVTGGGALKAGGVGAGVGFATGYAQGAGTDYSRQMGEVASGLRQEVSPGQVAHAGLEPGFLFGGLGGVGHGIARSRQLGRERRAAAVDEWADKEVPAIGTEQLAVAEVNANDGPDWNQQQQPPTAPGAAPPPPGAPPAGRGRPGPGGSTFTSAPRPPGLPRGPGTFGPGKGYAERPGGDYRDMPGYGEDFVEPRPMPGDAPPLHEPTAPLTPEFPEIERPTQPWDHGYPQDPGLRPYEEGTRPFPMDPMADRRPRGPGYRGGDGGGGGGGPAPFTPDIPPVGKGKKAIAEARRRGTFGRAETAEQLARGADYAERVPTPGEDAAYDFEHVREIPRVPTPGEHAMAEQKARETERDRAAAEEAQKHEPPVPLGHTRLYRVEGEKVTDLPQWLEEHAKEKGLDEIGGRWFTDDRTAVEWYLRDRDGKGRVHHVDLPTQVAEKYRVGKIKEKIRGDRPERYSLDTATEYVLPREIAKTKKDTAHETAEHARRAKEPAEREDGPIKLGKAERAKVSDFGEQPEAKIDWRDRDRIEKALASKDANTRNQWANRLQRARDAGETPSLDALPVLGQRMLRDIRDHIDRMMGDHPQGTIDAIRGRHTERIPETEMTPENKDGLTALKAAATADDLKYLNATTYQLLKGGLKSIVWNRLPKIIRDIMDEMPPEQRRAVVDAYTKHAHEAVDFMHGKEREPEPAQYRYKGEPDEGVRIAKLKVEEEAAAAEASRKEEAKSGSEAPGRPQRSIEDTFAEIADELPKEPPPVRSMEERLGLTEKKSLGQQLRENVLEARWRAGTVGASLEPRLRAALERMRDRLERNPSNDPVQIMGALRRAIAIANSTDAYYRAFTSGKREEMVRTLREKDRTADRRAVEEKVRDDVIQKVLTDEKLSTDRLADEFMVDKKTGQRRATTDEKTTVRDLFERLMNMKNYAETGELFGGVPDHSLLMMTSRMLDLGRARLEVAERALQDLRFKKTSSQISYAMPTKRGGKNPWLDRLVDLGRMVRGLERYTYVDKDGVLTLKPSKRALLKGTLVNMFVHDRLMNEPSGDIAALYETHRGEQIKNQYDKVHERLQGLATQLAEQQGYEDLIAGVRKRFPDQQKIVLSADEGAAWNDARRKYNPQRQQHMKDEQAKLAKQLQEMDTLSGLDPYAVHKEGDMGDLENRLIEALDNEKFVDEMSRHSVDFLIDNVLTANEATLIQKAREQRRMNEADRLLAQERGTRNQTPTDKADVVRQKVDPEKATRRAMAIGEEMARLNDVLDQVPDTLKGRVKPTVELLHSALDDDGITRSKAATEKNVEALFNELEGRLKGLEEEQRAVAIDANPSMVNEDYAIRRILDPAADLSLATNLPKGAYVKSVNDFLRFGVDIDGNQRSIRPPSTNHANTMLNSVFDVAAKVVGDVKVVVLTPEQMRLAAETRNIPVPEGFYDPKSHRIFVLREAVAPNNPNRARILGHEIVHPLTEVAIQRFPEIGRRLDAIRLQLQKEWLTPGSPTRDILGGRANALDNVHEFLSDLFNDGGALQRALRALPDTPGLNTAERQTALTKMGKGNLLMRALTAIRDGVFRMFLQINHKNALSSAMIHSMDLFQSIEAVSDRLASGRERIGLRGGDMIAGSQYMRPKFDPETMAPRPMPADDWNRPAGVPKSRAEEAYDRASAGLRDNVDKAKFFWSRIDGRTGAALWGHDLAQMARRAEPAMQAAVEKVRLALAHSFKSAKRIMDESGAVKLAEEIADVMRRSPKAWARFENYYDHENQSAVSGSEKIGEGRNKWITDGIEHTQAREDHAILSAEYASMPVPMKELHAKLRKFYDKRHDELVDGNLGRIVDLQKMAPDTVTRDALIKFIKDKNSISAAERADLEAKVKGFEYEYNRANTSPEHLDFRQKVRDMRAVGHLRSIPGVWFPKMRRGNWVVEGVFNLDRLAKDGVERERGQWEFDSEEKRDAFIKAMAADPVLKKIKFIEKSDGKAEVAEGEAPRWGAKYNPLMLEFHESQYDATVHHRDLTAEYGDNIKMTNVEPRRVDKSTYLTPVKADRALTAMQNSLKKSAGWSDLDATTQNRLQRNMEEAAFRHIMSTSARATYLPRTYALGARKDVMRDFLEYSTNTSYSLGELHHRNELATAYKEMDDYVDSNKHVGSVNDPQGTYGVLRRQIQQSLHRRADYVPDPVFGPWWKKSIARALQLSYLDKLVSPTNWLLNATEQIITGAPLLAGVHGIRAYGALIKASSDMGWSRYLDGFRDASTVAKARVGGVPDLPDNVARFKEATAHLSDAKAIHALLDKLEEMGHLDRDSSMEMGRIFDPGANRALRTVDYVDNVTRQISAAIDNGNRVAVGIAALRMALSDGKGGGMSLKDAIAHAEKYVHKTTGNYAKYNEAEMFRHPALAPALQFKRYAQRMTANWLAAGYQALWFGDVPVEQRWVARRQLAYMAGTIIAVSGTLGLPTEPIKGVINLFSPITGFNSDDAENWYRQRMAGMLGKDLGSIISNGIPRYLNVGIGTRLGLDSMWTYGAPSDRAGSLATSIGHLVAGAPGGMVADMVEGTGDLAKAGMNFARGETTDGWNNLRHGATAVFPLKILSDVVDHTATYINGPGGRTRYGTPQGYQTTPGETLMGIAGIRSGRSQERTDLNRAATRIKAKMNEGRNEAYDRYVNASSPAEKSAIWEGIRERYNKTYPEAAITRADLLRAEQRHRKGLDVREDHPEYGGLTLSRRQRDSIVSRTSAYMTP